MGKQPTTFLYPINKIVLKTNSLSRFHHHDDVENMYNDHDIYKFK